LAPGHALWLAQNSDYSIEQDAHDWGLQWGGAGQGQKSTILTVLRLANVLTTASTRMWGEDLNGNEIAGCGPIPDTY